MTAQGQAGRRGDGWISVEERLPHPWEKVIVYLPPNPTGLYADGIVIVAESDESGQWWDIDSTVRVTHWMPLPDPPVEDGQERSDA